MGTDFGDFNNDGFLDLIVTNFQDEITILYKNEGNGFFSDITYISGIGEKTLSILGWGTAFFDYDNNADKDFFIVNGHVCDNINKIHPEKTYPQTNQLFENLGNEVYREVTTRGIVCVEKHRAVGPLSAITITMAISIYWSPTVTAKRNF